MSTITTTEFRALRGTCAHQWYRSGWAPMSPTADRRRLRDATAVAAQLEQWRVSSPLGANAHRNRSEIIGIAHDPLSHDRRRVEADRNVSAARQKPRWQCEPPASPDAAGCPSGLSQHKLLAARSPRISKQAGRPARTGHAALRRRSRPDGTPGRRLGSRMPWTRRTASASSPGGTRGRRAKTTPWCRLAYVRVHVRIEGARGVAPTPDNDRTAPTPQASHRGQQFLRTHLAGGVDPEILGAACCGQRTDHQAVATPAPRWP